jgi:hypothetical protein
MKTFSVATAMATAVLALALTGCGTGSPKVSSSSGNSRTSADEQQKDQELKYVECLRKNGMKIADPVDGRYDLDNSDSKDPKSKAALAACAQYAPSQERDEFSAEEQDAMVKMAQCMRKHGIKVQDPPKNPNVAVGVPSGTSPEEFEKVQQICRKETGQGG